MARRLNPKHDEQTRAKIQTSQLVNRLNKNALGELPKEMTNGQIKSAEILLKKTLPDLQSITYSGDDDEPIVVNHVGLSSLMDRVNTELEQARAKDISEIPSKN